MHANPYIIIYIIPTLFSCWLAYYGWRRRKRVGARPFSFLMVSLAIWCLCHSASVASTDLEMTRFWAQAQYAGIVSIGPCWLLFALAYADRGIKPGFWVYGTMFMLAAASYAAVLTNESHHLWWATVEFATDRPYGSLVVTRGPLFWVHALLAYGYLLAGIALFLSRAFSQSRFYRHQSWLVVIGAIIPLLGNLTMLSGYMQVWVDDPTPFLLLISSLALFYASNRYQLLDLAPIAQREMFENIPDGVIVLDTRGYITAANRSAQQFLSTPTADVIGKPIVAAMHDSPLATDIRHMLIKGSIAQTRRLNYTIESQLHGVEIRMQPLREQDGNQAGSMLMIRDTSDQARAEHARDQRLAEVSLLHQISRAANSVVNTDDVLCTISTEMLRALPWSRVVISLFEADTTTLRIVADQQQGSHSALIGRVLDHFTFGQVHELLQQNKLSIINRNNQFVVDTPLGEALSQMDVATVLFVPLYSQSNPLGMLFLGSAGERTISEDELRLFETIGKLIGDTIARTQLYDAAREASQLKSSFLATVSHELRTPLTSIIGFADMLHANLLGPLEPDSKVAVDHIKRGSHLLLRLINDILDFSKMEAGHFSFDLYPVDMRLVVEVVVGAMQPQLINRGLEMVVDIPETLPMVQANSTRLEQVLTNLVANAIKFTETGCITITASTFSQHVRLSVRDTGIGISPEHQEIIFDAFRQAENPLTRRYGGTGLGLAISRRLVELMGGTLTMESELEVGSVFHCDLFASATDALREQAIAAAPQPEPVHATQ